jgi:hypothetical protein
VCEEMKKTAENAKSNGIFDLIENDSTNRIKMNHIKTMLCGHFIGIDKLERLKLLQNDSIFLRKMKFAPHTL